MHRVDTEGHDDGLFQDGNPQVGQQGTTLSEDWFNDLQENICKVIEHEDAGAAALVKGDHTQLRLAIAAMIDAAKTAVIAATRTPVGALGQFDRLTVPAGGWLAYDGDEHLKADYPDLVALWTTEGRLVDGSTAAYFVVPNREGYFARSTSTDASVNPNGAKTAASAPAADTLKAHTHTLPANSGNSTGGGSVEDDNNSGTPQVANTGSTGDLETAPKHVFFLWCVKT